MRLFDGFRLRGRLRTGILKGMVAAGLAVAAVALTAQYGETPVEAWWEPGNGRSFPMWATFPDSSGELMVLNAGGPFETQGHAFFDGMGTNGRACVTCHQPSNAMSLSVEQVRERWAQTKGKDPVFAAVDGANCPTLALGERSSHSLLLDRGLFRISLPWPALGADGRPIKPEFTIEVVKDPTGCNTDPKYGLASEHPAISVFRRPRVVGNLKYVVGSEDVANGPTGVRVSLAADGRDATLAQQAAEAMHAHEQLGGNLTPAQMRQILAFEGQVYVAQNADATGGQLAEVDGPLGAWSLGRGKVADDRTPRAVFFDASYWSKPGAVTKAEADFRASVARGNSIFASRQFAIEGVANLTDGHAGTPTMGTCATCHTAVRSGSNQAQRAMDVGTTELVHAAGTDDLPLFKVTCSAAAAPHPYLGRVIYTTDPGRALVTGKCSDVGSIVMQQFRGLSARAPYFSNGSAKSLADVVDYYDQRFDIGLSKTEKQDLVNFLRAL